MNDEISQFLLTLGLGDVLYALVMMLIGRGAINQPAIVDLLGKGDEAGALDAIAQASTASGVPVTFDSAVVLQNRVTAPPTPTPAKPLFVIPKPPAPPRLPGSVVPVRSGADVVDPAARIIGLLDQQEPRIATVFRTAIAGLKENIDLTELADLIQQGRLDEALGQLQSAGEALGAATNVAFVTSGQSTANFLTAANVGRVVFNQVNHRAVAAMQANQLETVREFTDEQRRATSLALIGGVERGANPREQARDFRDSIGLTETQWKAVASYRAGLETIGSSEPKTADVLGRALRDKRGDAQVRRAVRETKALPAEKVDWLVQRYTEKYVKYRSEVIGRTEALRAVHQGTQEMYQQAIDDGTISADALVRKWVTRIDGRERRTHKFLTGQERSWGGVWTTQNGTLKYPGDPDAPAVETIQCRCVVTTRIRGSGVSPARR